MPLIQVEVIENVFTQGLSNSQVAATIVVSEHTVHRHVANIARKLDQPSCTAAAMHGLQTGLI
jgi:DNA-binding NarL/FixJ family response regulator